MIMIHEGVKNFTNLEKKIRFILSIICVKFGTKLTNLECFLIVLILGSSKRTLIFLKGVMKVNQHFLLSRQLRVLDGCRHI